MVKKNVIDFTSLTKIYELHFRCPLVLRINQKNADNVQYEIDNGVGKAWVPAVSLIEAKRKLHSILTITEWIDV